MKEKLIRTVFVYAILMGAAVSVQKYKIVDINQSNYNNVTIAALSIDNVLPFYGQYAENPGNSISNAHNGDGNVTDNIKNMIPPKTLNLFRPQH